MWMDFNSDPTLGIYWVDNNIIMALSMLMREWFIQSTLRSRLGRKEQPGSGRPKMEAPLIQRAD